MAALRGGFVTLCIVLVIGLHLHADEVHGKRSSTIDDLKLESQLKILKILNKSPTKTFKTDEGDIIDCIDIYKQPSLDHPLLKNHKIQMRPTIVSKKMMGGSLSTTHTATTINHNNSVMPEGVDCPEGTVPIQRIRKEDLARANSFFESFSTNSGIQPVTSTITPGKHLAIVRSVPNPTITYKGIQATFNLHNPSTQAGQFSSSQIWIESGAPDVHNSLQTGWMVAPDLYGDNRTRSFAYWSVEGISRQGCFNYFCQGFIQVDKKIFTGGVKKTSTYGSPNQLQFTKRIIQDPYTGDWWLTIPNHNINIGYWPKALLPSLAQGGSQVAWGGQVTTSTTGASPQMGSGYFPGNDFGHGCYISQMKVFDTYSNPLNPAPPLYQNELFVDNTQCYNLIGYGFNENLNYEYSFNFGGPGGNNCGI